MKQNKILKAKCIYCHKETYSMYKSQLDHNAKMHETYCPMRPKEPVLTKEAVEWTRDPKTGKRIREK